MSSYLHYYAAREHFADLERRAAATRAVKRLDEETEAENSAPTGRRYFLRVRRVARVAS